MTIELNPITSGYSTGLINDNFQAIEDYVNDKLLQRDGVETGEINQMEVDLDMNSHFVYNLPEPVLEHQAARLQDVQNAVAGGAANLISFTPYGSITSENVQGAIQELEDQAAQDPNTFEVDTETGTQTLQDALNDRATKTDIAGFASTQETLLTVNIPTDYATLQEAIDDLSTLSVKQGVIIDLVVESGHSPTTGIAVQDGNYAHFRVSCQDAELVIDPSFTGYFISASNCLAPRLNCLVNGSGSADRCYSLVSATGWVNVSCGGKNFTGRVLYGNVSLIHASQSTWADSLRIYGNNAKINLGSATLSGFTEVALYASRATQIECQGVSISDSQSAIVATSGATVNARLATIENSSGQTLAANRGGVVSCQEAVITGCGAEGVSASGGSSVFVDDTSFTAAVGNTSDGIAMSGGCRLSAARATVTGFGEDGVIMQQNCSATLNASSVTNNGNMGVRFFDKSTGTVKGADVTGNGNLDLNIGFGSEILASSCTTSNGAGSPSLADTNVSAFNAIDSNNGIIWV